MERVLLTGGAGFIGSHLTERLLRDGRDVVVVDNLDPYYDVRLKRKNLQAVEEAAASDGAGKYTYVDADVTDLPALRRIIDDHEPQAIFHEAAQAGVRASVDDPFKPNLVNVVGTMNVLVAARDAGVERVVNASSSSVYGTVAYLPFDEHHPLRPVSPYGVSKLAAEHYCRVFTEVYGISTISLRYFTVYGPRMRPDLAVPRFSKRLLRGIPPVIFGDGEQTRDYTFVDDIVEANVRLLDPRVELKGQAINIGSSQRISINDLVDVLRDLIGSEVDAEYEDRAVGDARDTCASIEEARRLINYEPSTTLQQGLTSFLLWFRSDTEAQDLTL
ncbi:MAG: NAD-dependent epimerase/dehydratase family protein [Thermoplasmata archaeon]|nr:NAD-dependent epimerase/dehydratase family protein [Thermoplasmata archaeon]